MKRGLVVSLIIAALAAVLLGGCKLGSNGVSVGGSGTVAQPVVGAPAIGMLSLGSFLPQSGAMFSNGFAAVGETVGSSSSDLMPTVLSPLGGTKWHAEKIGSVARYAMGAAEAGHTRVVVGMTAPAGASTDQVLFAATSDSGGAFQVRDLGELFGRRSAALIGIASTGESVGSTPILIAAGSVARVKGGVIGNPVGTDAMVLISKDSGKTWVVGLLPVPGSVTGAEVTAITFSPHSNAFPGVLVAGKGWTSPKGKLHGAEVALLWGTRDGGATWRFISDPVFSAAGRDFEPTAVAADAATVIVAGTADVSAKKSGAGPKQRESIEWVGGIDGAWHVITDGSSLQSGRSSAVTALFALDGGGYVMASETYDTTAGGAYHVGQPLKGNPAVQLSASPDSIVWGSGNASVPGIGSAATVNGIAEFGSRVAFFGVDKQSHGQAWVVDRGSIQ